jgi:inner membrane protein
MIFFGHLGITTGVLKIYEKVFYKEKDLNIKTLIDYRVVLVGAILPDIIDKPIGAYLFRNTFHNSRIFAHTLVFSGILAFIGLYMLYKHRKSNILILGLCTFIHLILDSMWLYPGILFWSYYGLKFPQRAEGNWISSDIVSLITDPSYYLPEIIGFGIIAYYFWKLVKNKQVKAFISEGKL